MALLGCFCGPQIVDFLYPDIAGALFIPSDSCIRDLSGLFMPILIRHFLWLLRQNVIKTRLLLDIYAYEVHAFVVYLFVMNMGHFSSVVLHLLVRVWRCVYMDFEYKVIVSWVNGVFIFWTRFSFKMCTTSHDDSTLICLALHMFHVRKRYATGCL